MKCLSPKTIYNRYLNSYVTVPCGNCSACKILKKNILSLKISNECDKHAYNIFFTLTYDNDHIPIIRRNSNIIKLRRRKVLQPRYYDYNEHCYKQDTVEVCKYDYIDCNINSLDIAISNITNCGGSDIDNISNGQYIGVLYKKDLQNFFKKLRYEGKKAGFTDTLRYFVCGEYGGKYNRPHYHGIIHTNNEGFATWLLQNLISFWGFSSIDSYSQKNNSGHDGKPKLINGKSVCSYVSKYVSLFDNGIENKFFGIFKCFYVASKRPYYGLSSFDEKVFEHVVSGKDYDIERTIIENGKSRVVTVSDNVQGRLYSRFDGIDKYDIDELCQMVVEDDEGVSSPIKRFIRRVRKVVKTYSSVNVITYSYVRQYLQAVFRFVDRLKSYKLKESMCKNFDIDYLISKIDTFSDILHGFKTQQSNYIEYLTLNLYNKFEQLNIPLRESLFVSLCEFLFYEHKFIDYFKQKNKLYLIKFQKSLLPKHFSNLNFM